MSAGGFRGRGYGSRGIRPQRPTGGYGGGPRFPHPNFNQSRQHSNHPPPRQDNWPDPSVRPPFPLWHQQNRNPQYSQRPPYHHNTRGRGGLNQRGGNMNMSSVPRRPLRFPNHFGSGGSSRFPHIQQPQERYEHSHEPLLGSEEERIQQISKTADRLKQKLSCITEEEKDNFWEDDMTLVKTSFDDTQQITECIPELKHGPPELNLTFNDFKDIGRVDNDPGNKLDNSNPNVDSDKPTEPSSNYEVSHDQQEQLQNIQKPVENSSIKYTGDNRDHLGDSQSDLTGNDRYMLRNYQNLKNYSTNERDVKQQKPFNHTSVYSHYQGEKVMHPPYRSQESEGSLGTSDVQNKEDVTAIGETTNRKCLNQENLTDKDTVSAETGKPPEQEFEALEPPPDFKFVEPPDFNLVDTPEVLSTPIPVPEIKKTPFIKEKQHLPEIQSTLLTQNFNKNSAVPQQNSRSESTLQPPLAFDPRISVQERAKLLVRNSLEVPSRMPMVGPMMPGNYPMHMPQPAATGYIPNVPINFPPVMPCHGPATVPFLPPTVCMPTHQLPLPPPPPPAGDPPAEALSLMEHLGLEDGLEDMQEAMAFAKQFMDMSTEPISPKKKKKKKKKLRNEEERYDTVEPNPETVKEIEPIQHIETETSERHKVVFNLPKAKKISQPEDWKQHGDDETKRKPHSSQKNKDGNNEKRIKIKTQNIPARLNQTLQKSEKISIRTSSTAEGHLEMARRSNGNNVHVSAHKKSRKKTTSATETSWKDRVINRFLKMSKNEIRNMINSSSLRKFDIPMQHLVKEKRSSLSLEMRNTEDEKVKEYDGISEEFMSQLSAMLDPSAVVDISNLPNEFIYSLNEFLQLESLPPLSEMNGNELSEYSFVDNEVAKENAAVLQIDPKNDNRRQTRSNRKLRKETLEKQKEIVEKQKEAAERNKQVTTRKFPTAAQKKEHLRNSLLQKQVKEDVQSTEARFSNITNYLGNSGANNNRVETSVKDTCEINQVPEKMVAHAIDDIFSAGLLKNRTQSKSSLPSTAKRTISIASSSLASRSTLVKETQAEYNLHKDPVMETLEKTAVDLDDIFSAGIARAKLGLTKNSFSENKQGNKQHSSRKTDYGMSEQYNKSEKWKAKKVREDLDIYRNLTKEEWEAKYGATSSDGSEKLYRSTSSYYQRNIPNSPTVTHRTVVDYCFDKDETERRLILEQNRESDNSEEEISGSNDDDDDDDGSSSSSSSSSGSSDRSTNVTKLLKVIKEREKIAKKKSLNETIRDEVAAEIERKWKEKEKYKKSKKNKKKKDRRGRKKRLKKRKKKRTRDSSSEQDEEDEETIDRNAEPHRLLTEEEIKKEIKHEPDADCSKTSVKIMPNTTVVVKPTVANTAKHVDEVVKSAPVHKTDKLLTNPSPLLKTKAQLKLMPENSGRVDIVENQGMNPEKPPEMQLNIYSTLRKSKPIVPEVVNKSNSKEVQKITQQSEISSQIAMCNLATSVNDITSVSKTKSTAEISKPILTKAQLKNVELSAKKQTDNAITTTSVKLNAKEEMVQKLESNKAITETPNSDSGKSKKLDINTYKARMQERQKIEQQKLNQQDKKVTLLTNNPTLLTQDLLNIPLIKRPINNVLETDATSKLQKANTININRLKFEIDTKQKEPVVRLKRLPEFPLKIQTEKVDMLNTTVSKTVSKVEEEKTEKDESFAAIGEIKQVKVKGIKQGTVKSNVQSDVSKLNNQNDFQFSQPTENTSIPDRMSNEVQLNIDNAVNVCSSKKLKPSKKNTAKHVLKDDDSESAKFQNIKSEGGKEMKLKNRKKKESRVKNVKLNFTTTICPTEKKDTSVKFESHEDIKCIVRNPSPPPTLQCILDSNANTGKGTCENISEPVKVSEAVEKDERLKYLIKEKLVKKGDENTVMKPVSTKLPFKEGNAGGILDIIQKITSDQKENIEKELNTEKQTERTESTENNLNLAIVCAEVKNVQFEPDVIETRNVEIEIGLIKQIDNIVKTTDLKPTSVEGSKDRIETKTNLHMKETIQMDICTEEKQTNIQIEKPEAVLSKFTSTEALENTVEASTKMSIIETEQSEICVKEKQSEHIIENMKTTINEPILIRSLKDTIGDISNVNTEYKKQIKMRAEEKQTKNTNEVKGTINEPTAVEIEKKLEQSNDINVEISTTTQLRQDSQSNMKFEQCKNNTTAVTANVVTEKTTDLYNNFAVNEMEKESYVSQCDSIKNDEQVIENESGSEKITEVDNIKSTSDALPDTVPSEEMKCYDEMDTPLFNEIARLSTTPVNECMDSELLLDHVLPADESYDEQIDLSESCKDEMELDMNNLRRIVLGGVLNEELRRDTSEIVYDDSINCNSLRLSSPKNELKDDEVLEDSSPRSSGSPFKGFSTESMGLQYLQKPLFNLELDEIDNTYTETLGEEETIAGVDMDDNVDLVKNINDEDNILPLRRMCEDSISTIPNIETTPLLECSESQYPEENVTDDIETCDNVVQDFFEPIIECGTNAEQATVPTHLLEDEEVTSEVSKVSENEVNDKVNEEKSVIEDQLQHCNNSENVETSNIQTQSSSCKNNDESTHELLPHRQQTESNIEGTYLINLADELENMHAEKKELNNCLGSFQEQTQPEISSDIPNVFVSGENEFITETINKEGYEDDVVESSSIKKESIKSTSYALPRLICDEAFSKTIRIIREVDKPFFSTRVEVPNETQDSGGTENVETRLSETDILKSNFASDESLPPSNAFEIQDSNVNYYKQIQKHQNLENVPPEFVYSETETIESQISKMDKVDTPLSPLSPANLSENVSVEKDDVVSQEQLAHVEIEKQEDEHKDEILPRCEDDTRYDNNDEKVAKDEAASDSRDQEVVIKSIMQQAPYVLLEKSKDIENLVKDKSIDEDKKDSDEMLHRVKKKHKMKKKRSKRHYSEKEVKEAVKAGVIDQPRRHINTREYVMDRMLAIDLEINKLMTEKLALHQLLSSGKLISESDLPKYDERNNTDVTKLHSVFSDNLPKPGSSTESVSDTNPLKRDGTSTKRDKPEPTMHVEESDRVSKKHTHKKRNDGKQDRSKNDSKKSHDHSRSKEIRHSKEKLSSREIRLSPIDLNHFEKRSEGHGPDKSGQTINKIFVIPRSEVDKINSDSLSPAQKLALLNISKDNSNECKIKKVHERIVKDSIESKKKKDKYVESKTNIFEIAHDNKEKSIERVIKNSDTETEEEQDTKRHKFSFKKNKVQEKNKQKQTMIYSDESSLDLDISIKPETKKITGLSLLVQSLQNETNKAKTQEGKKRKRRIQDSGNEYGKDSPRVEPLKKRFKTMSDMKRKPKLKKPMVVDEIVEKHINETINAVLESVFVEDEAKEENAVVQLSESALGPGMEKLNDELEKVNNIEAGKSTITESIKTIEIEYLVPEKDDTEIQLNNDRHKENQIISEAFLDADSRGFGDNAVDFDIDIAKRISVQSVESLTFDKKGRENSVKMPRVEYRETGMPNVPEEMKRNTDQPEAAIRTPEVVSDDEQQTVNEEGQKKEDECDQEIAAIEEQVKQQLSTESDTSKRMKTLQQEFTYDKSLDSINDRQSAHFCSQNVVVSDSMSCDENEYSDAAWSMEHNLHRRSKSRSISEARSIVSTDSSLSVFIRDENSNSSFSSSSSRKSIHRKRATKRCKSVLLRRSRKSVEEFSEQQDEERTTKKRLSREKEVGSVARTTSYEDHQKNRKRKIMSMNEMMNCKVRLVDSKYIYLRPDVSPNVLQKVGITHINIPQRRTDSRASKSRPTSAVGDQPDRGVSKVEQEAKKIQKADSTTDDTASTLVTSRTSVGSCSFTATLENCEVRRSPRIMQYTMHKGPILDIKVFDESFLAASEDGSLYRYSQTSDQLLNIYKGHTNAVTCLCILKQDANSDSKREWMYSGSLDGTLRCYDIRTSVQIKHATDVGSPIQCMDQAWGSIFIGTKSGQIARFHTKSASVRDEEQICIEKSVLALKATNEGMRKVLIVAARNQPITIRDAVTGLFLRSISGQRHHTVYSLLRNNSLIYCGTSTTSIPVFDFITGEEITQFNAGVGIVCMCLYEELLFAGCYDGNIYVFDLQKREMICSIPGPGHMLLSMEVVNRRIIAGSKNKNLLAWDMPEQVQEVLNGNRR